MLFPKTNKYSHISRTKQLYKWYGLSADVKFKTKNGFAQGSNMEYHIQNQRDHGPLTKDILRFLNSAIKIMRLNWMGVFCPGTTRLDLFSTLFGDSILFTLLPR